MDSDTDTDSEMSSPIQTPIATPINTTAIQIPAIKQSQSDSLNERWSRVQSKLGSKIESVPNRKCFPFLSESKFWKTQLRLHLSYFKI